MKFQYLFFVHGRWSYSGFLHKTVHFIQNKTDREKDHIIKKIKEIKTFIWRHIFDSSIFCGSTITINGNMTDHAIMARVAFRFSLIFMFLHLHFNFSVSDWLWACQISLQFCFNSLRRYVTYKTFSLKIPEFSVHSVRF